MSRRSRQKARKGVEAMRAQRRRLEAEVADLEQKAAELRRVVPPLLRAAVGLAQGLNRADDFLGLARRAWREHLHRHDPEHGPALLPGMADVAEAHAVLVVALNGFDKAATAAMEADDE